jgi:hypothetical protein
MKIKMNEKIYGLYFFQHEFLFSKFQAKLVLTGGRLTKIHLIEIVFYQLIEIFIIS